MKVNGTEALMLMKPMNPDSRFFGGKKRKTTSLNKLPKTEKYYTQPEAKLQKNRSIRESITSTSQT